MPETLYQAHLAWGATVGLVVEDGRVKDAAPLLRWAIGRPWPYIDRWIRTRDGWVEEVREKGGDGE